MKVKLTDAYVASAGLPPGKTDLVVWDTETAGFGLRIRQTKKSFYLTYRPPGMGRAANPKHLKLGNVGNFENTKEARRAARVVLGKILMGEDPLVTRRAARIAERAKLSDLIDKYEADLERRGYVNSKTVASGLRTKMGKLLTRDIREITGAEIAAIVERLQRAKRAGAGADFRSRVRTFFNWAVSVPKVLDASPLAGHRKQRATRADRVLKAEHGRALSDAELAKVWHAAHPGTVFGRYVRFLILTGCRRGEGTGLTWQMVDREERLINLPAVFTKQGRGHIVPIAPALAAVFDACEIDTRSDPPLVFASPRSGRAMSGHTQLLDKMQRGWDFSFRYHDLRRTFRTGLSTLGVEPQIAELALGHARSDLEARYNRDKGGEPLRKAFELWAQHVEKITAKKPVNAFE